MVASAAIIVNLVIGLWLHRGSKDDLNIRSAYGLQRYRTMNTARPRVEHLREFLAGGRSRRSSKSLRYASRRMAL